MYLNLHILFSFAAANPNRDDAGSPKSIDYGGATRSRISSQAMTRPKRHSFEAGSDADRTFRSALVAEKITELVEKLIAEAGDTITEQQTAALRATATKTITSLTAKDREKEPKQPKRRGKGAATEPAAADGDTETADADEETVDGPKATLIWLAEKEIRAAAHKAFAGITAGEPPALAIEDFVQSQRTDSLTIAGFGRMFAQRPDLAIEAAIQRSHAFTTHATVSEVDYFTAVDDLRNVDRGAGHLGINELTGGVYYWHANLSVRQLAAAWAGIDRPDAAARLTALFEALMLALPTGRQATTAYHTLPALVLAVPAKLPASLQTAFETPIAARNGSGYLAPSVDGLVREHTRTVAALPSRFRPARYAGTAADTVTSGDHAQPAGSLEDLAAWCAEQVLAAAAQLS